MNPHCVPEWEPAERDLDFDIFESDDFAYQSKSKIWDLGPPKKPDVAFVPDDDFEELCWENGQLLVVMQGLGNRSGAKGIGAHPNVAADRASPPKVTSKDNVNRSCITWEPSPVELNPSSCTNFTQDDDLLSWLQHPQDDNLNAKSFDATCTHTLSASKTITQNSKLDTALGCMPQQKWMQGGNNLHVVDNYDLAVSASNNAHCLTRSTACNGVCGSSGEHEAEKGSMPCNPIHMGISSWTDASNSESSLTQIRVKENTAHGQGTIITCSMHAPGQGHELQNECECSINSSRVKGLNFANFSRPATAIKADLHTVGIASGPSGANRVKQQERLRANLFASEPSNLTTEPVVSTTTLKEECSGSQSAAWSCTPHAGDSLPQGKQDTQGAHHRSDMSMAVNVDLHGSTDIPNTKQVVAYSLAEDSYQSCQVTEQNEEVSESKPAALKRSKHSSVEVSSSGKKTHKKKGSAITSKISKRNRTAESHNLSERKRRSKIKEKMIALQELIPNVNKTDKASMLEEAIAYLKSLQQKVQIMAFRGGLNRQWTSHFPLQIPGEEKTVLPRIPMDASMHEVLDMASKVSDLPVVQGAPLSPLHSSMMMPAMIGQPLPRTTLMTAPFAGIVHQGLTHPAYQMYLPVQPVILPNVMHPVYKSER